MDISTVLLSLQSILDNDPLLNEPGFHRNNKHQLKMINNYNDVIFCENIKSLIMKNYSNIPEDFIVFKDTIIDNFKNNYMKIYNNILKYKELSDRNIIINIYRINYEIKIKEIIDSYLDFCNKLNLIILNN